MLLIVVVLVSRSVIISDSILPSILFMLLTYCTTSTDDVDRDDDNVLEAIDDDIESYSYVSGCDLVACEYVPCATLLHALIFRDL
jgi:hypothetical protein